MLPRISRRVVKDSGPSPRRLSTTSCWFRVIRPPNSFSNPFESSSSSGPSQKYLRSSTAWLHAAHTHRNAAGFTRKSSQSAQNPVHTPASDKEQDDTLLRAIFDSGHTSSAFTSDSPTGLFCHPNLRDPQYFITLTQQTLQHAQHLVDRITRILPSFEPTFPGSPFTRLDPSSADYSTALRQTPKLLDRLSDILCLVMDMSELVRNVHPVQEWIQQTDAVYEVLGRYMNGLNTHQGLYEALKLCRDSPHDPPLSESELQLIQTFMNDFEKSGIHLDTSRRQRFVDLSDEIQVLGRRFLGDIAAGQNGNSEAAGMEQVPMIEIPRASDALEGFDKRVFSSLPAGGSRGPLRDQPRSSRFVAPGSWEAQMILRFAPKSEARKIVYEGSNRADPARIAVLENLLAKRGELARVLGKESWSEVQLTDKMAKTPANVMGFLHSLATNNRPRAAEDVAKLARMKAQEMGSTANGSPTINAWDRDYYTNRLVTEMAPTSGLHPIGQYFSAGTVVQGLSRLFSRLYGLRFVPDSLRPGEAWSEDVRKVKVVDEDEGVVGIIYFDLFNRPNKSPNAAHYTVRCSRRIDNDDLEGDRLPTGWDWSLGMTGVEGALEGVKVNGHQGRYQLPLVVLSTDFARPTMENGPSLLAWPEVETLFHEMGHAIHSMLGRTEYHNVSGTRCATDFVELPSILMESFVTSSEVLPLFARHWHTDAPLPLEHFRAHVGLYNNILTALETHGQIIMASLDQAYHSPSASVLGFDTTDTYSQLQKDIGVIPPVPETAWQTQFGHLYGYGATYYSYLLDRAIAKKVWQSLFAQHPLSRTNGKKFRNEVLGWGGGKDPWEMVATVVGDDSLAKGDWEAMKKVGKWLD